MSPSIIVILVMASLPFLFALATSQSLFSGIAVVCKLLAVCLHFGCLPLFGSDLVFICNVCDVR